MKILLDQGAPLPLRYSMTGHEFHTVHEQNWTNLSDAEVLDVAHQSGFDVFITPDTRLSTHYRLAKDNPAVVVLGSSRWKLIRLVLGEIEAAIQNAARGTYTFVEVPDHPRQ